MTTASTVLVPCELPEGTDQAFYLFKLKKKILAIFGCAAFIAVQNTL